MASPVSSRRDLCRVAAPSDRGGGVLAQAAVMLAQSNGQDAHAVNRGVWIRSRLLGDPPSDPPPDVASLPEPSSDAKARVPVSIKQRLDLHLKTGTTCYDCHKDIDPWGIATEGLDAVGLLRRSIKKAGPVVKKVTIEEQEIDGLLPLKKFLLEQAPQAILIWLYPSYAFLCSGQVAHVSR